MKPRHVEIRAVHAKQQARAVIDGALVVGQARAVGGADFAESGAAFGHDVGNAEAVADFDELTAGDDDFTAAGESGQHQKNSGGVVVDDDGGFGAGQARQQARRVNVASAPRASFQVVFEIGILRCSGADSFDGFCSERRAAEVGVQDDPGGVDDGTQRGLKQLVNFGNDFRDELVRQVRRREIALGALVFLCGAGT